MTAIPVTTYLGTPEPQVSPFGRSSNLFAATPTTGEVVGSFVEEVFFGAGSLAQDIQASNIRKLERREEVISEDDWKDSDNFRPGIKYYDTMTKGSSKILAESEDDRDNRALVTSKASGLQTVAGFGVGFILGLGEPKNLATGLVATLLTAGAGSIIPALGRTIAVNTVRGAAVRGGVEGIAAAALTEPSNIESSKIVQGDYTMADSILNMTLGVVLGAGIGGGVKALQIRGAAKKVYRAETDDLALKELDTALAQTVEGSQVDVASVKQIENVEAKAKAQRELPKIEQKIATHESSTGIRVRDPSGFRESRVLNADGSLKVVYHGTGADFKTFNPFSHFGTAEAANFRIDPFSGTDRATLVGGARVMPVYLNIKNLLTIEDAGGLSDAKSIANAVLKKKVITIDEHDIITDFASQKNVYKKLASTLNKKGFDGISYKNAVEDVESVSYIPFKSEQIKSIFDETNLNTPEVRVSENLQAKKGQAETDIGLRVDQVPLTKLKNDISKNDNSTAYDPLDSERIQTELDEFGTLDDQIRLEQELEGIQEELAELNAQGLLNSEEIKTLERLAEIDAESAIFDNVLLQSKLCLTRG